MKQFLLAATLGLALLISSVANAALLTTSFTSDNEITGFTYSVDGVQTVVDISSLGALNNWQLSSMLALTIADGSNYEFIWDIQNYGSVSSSNPVGFLAEFALNGVSYFTNNIMWEVKSQSTGNVWQLASLNNGNGTDAFNQGSNIWGSNAPNTISTSAQWLWDGATSSQSNTMSFRASVAQVSTPSVFGLMGVAMLLLGLRARRG